MPSFFTNPKYHLILVQLPNKWLLLIRQIPRLSEFTNTWNLSTMLEPRTVYSNPSLHSCFCLFIVRLSTNYLLPRQKVWPGDKRDLGNMDNAAHKPPKVKFLRPIYISLSGAVTFFQTTRTNLQYFHYVFLCKLI